MRPNRLGIHLFGVGLAVALVSAVVDGGVMQSTLVACPGHEPTYSFDGVSYVFWVVISDGCNSHTINPVVTIGSYITLAGLGVGLGGVLREWSTG
ncbi:MAG: hypothetical protein ACOCP2_03060 [Halohasta sp.]